MCVFAKPPRPGRAKTRLAAKIGDEAACRLATAFISDFITFCDQFDWGFPILATTDDGMPDGAFPPQAYPSDVQPDAVPKWLQPDGDLGAKIEGIVRQGLAQADAVICLGADSPGRPIARLEQTYEALMSGTDVVLGPTEDGGYDILAMRTCPDGLLADLPWSQPTTFEASKRRFEDRGLKVHVLEQWWDVDEVEDLERLRSLLAGEGAARAPATAYALAQADAGNIAE